jgi:hypothetical protein
MSKDSWQEAKQIEDFHKKLKVWVCLIPAICFQPDLGTKTHQTIYSGKWCLNPLLDYLAGEEQGHVYTLHSL